MINNRQDVLVHFTDILVEVREVNQKWHFNFDGTPKERDEDTEPRCILLMKSELMEAFEAYRKGNQADDKLPQYPGEAVEIIDLFIRSVDFIVFDPDAISLVGDVIETLAEPWDIGSATTMNFYASLDTTLTNMYEDKSFVAGVIDHVVAYCDALQIPLLEIYRAKTDFNKTRKDHSVEARQAVGGKQF